MITVARALNVLVEAHLVKYWTKRKALVNPPNGTAWYWDILVETPGLSVSEETYGRKSCLYFNFDDPQDAIEAVRLLKHCHAQVNTQWSGNDIRRFEVTCRGIRGWHWWE